MKWPKKQWVRNDGKSVSIIEPVIVSASRVTDIPAFYSNWFLQQLQNGYTVWLNPFNRKPMYVGFDKTRLIVFWTKNPAPLLPLLDRPEINNRNYYFQFTLNNYEDEKFESNLPPLENRIETFIRLSETIGKQKVIWRFDPIVKSSHLPIDKIIEKIENIGNKLYRHTEKLVFSFIDIQCYSSVKRRIDKEYSKDIEELQTIEMLEIAERIAQLGQKWNLEIATCSEAISLEHLGIQHNKCIDNHLIEKLFFNDLELLSFISKHQRKDNGQRPNCGCIPSKDIGFYNSCPYQCIYCYANHR